MRALSEQIKGILLEVRYSDDFPSLLDKYGALDNSISLVQIALVDLQTLVLETILIHPGNVHRCLTMKERYVAKEFKFFDKDRITRFDSAMLYG